MPAKLPGPARQVIVLEVQAPVAAGRSGQCCAAGAKRTRDPGLGPPLGSALHSGCQRSTRLKDIGRPGDGASSRACVHPAPQAGPLVWNCRAQSRTRPADCLVPPGHRWEALPTRLASRERNLAQLHRWEPLPTRLASRERNLAQLHRWEALPTRLGSRERNLAQLQATTWDSAPGPQT
jgi:hypothetical protein